ncbi:MAG: hypothetical protein VW981_00220 [Rhodobiaceae bacterium]
MREWIDHHLAPMVERLVAGEIKATMTKQINTGSAAV